MLVSYYLPGNRSAPPPAHLVHGPTGHTGEEQSPFDPPPVRPVGGRRSYESDQNQCKVDTRMAGGWEEEQWDSDQKLEE